MAEYEVLAPVGTFKELKIVIEEHPDAIYVGMKGLTSRPSRTDFTNDEISDAIEMCHCNGIKIYVAVNSMIKEQDIDKLIQEIFLLDQAGVDAFIIADFGLIYRLSNKLNNAELHASTLLGVYNIETIKLLKEVGVKRIIFYANLYLDEMIRMINAVPDLDYELVAEGGTCFNDIRQCKLPHYISETEHELCCRCGCVLFDKAGNPTKGKTLAEHPCRVAEVLGLYMAAGIKSFKIEGRTVSAAERIPIIGDLKNKLNEFQNSDKSLNSYLHYINRMRREVL